MGRTDVVPLVVVAAAAAMVVLVACFDVDVVLGGAGLEVGFTASDELFVGLLVMVEVVEAAEGFFSAAAESFRGNVTLDGAWDVLRAVVLNVVFFLSSATDPVDAVDLCRGLAAVDAAAAVMPPVGLRGAVEVADSLVGGALRPPDRLAEVVDVLLGAVEVDVEPGRFVTVADGFLTGAASLLTTFLVADGEPCSDGATPPASVSPAVVGIAGFSTSAMLGVCVNYDFLKAGFSAVPNLSMSEMKSTERLGGVDVRRDAGTEKMLLCFFFPNENGVVGKSTDLPK